ncbi:hypothetical protein HK405_014900, partial [Cladochytrium tenue]
MSGFRNFNSLKPNTGAGGDDDDWRDSPNYDGSADEPAASVPQRLAQIGAKIPVGPPPRPAPKPAAAGASYAAYLQQRQAQAGGGGSTPAVTAAAAAVPPPAQTVSSVSASIDSFADEPAVYQGEGVSIPRRVSVSQRIGDFSKPAPPAGAVQLPFPAPANPVKPVKLPSPAPPPATIEPAAAPPPRPIAGNPFLQANRAAAATAAAAAAAAAPEPVATMPAFPRRLSSGQVSAASANPTSAGGQGIQLLAQKFPIFSASEISAFQQQFKTVDKDGSGSVHTSDLSAVAPKAGESVQDVVTKLGQLRLVGEDGSVTFEGFLAAVGKLRQDKGVAVGANKGRIVLHGQTSENVTHTINEDEKQSFVDHINQVLVNDKDISSRVPIDMYTMQIFSECKDGLVLAKLINDSVPNTIDERVLNIGKRLNMFQMTENNNVVVNSAKAIGCSVVNIGAQDLIEGREHLVLGLIWQIIKMGLQAKIDIKLHPELFRLLEPGETLEDFLKLGPEQILL